MEIAYPKYVLVYGYKFINGKYRLFVREKDYKYVSNTEKNILLNEYLNRTKSHTYNEVVARYIVRLEEFEIVFWSYKFKGETTIKMIRRLKLKTQIDYDEFNHYVDFLKPQY